MHSRTFGRTGWQVSEIGFVAWGIGGGQRGGADEADSMRTLHAALAAVKRPKVLVHHRW
jgi:aryl-alcohol dehydrogenase-like predicted oxidoreductase